MENKKDIYDIMEENSWKEFIGDTRSKKEKKVTGMKEKIKKHGFIKWAELFYKMAYFHGRIEKEMEIAKQEAYLKVYGV